MEKYLTYFHPAVAPSGIQLNRWYSLTELKEKFDMDYIVYHFLPANFGWEECEEIYPKKRLTNKETKIEEKND